MNADRNAAFHVSAARTVAKALFDGKGTGFGGAVLKHRIAVTDHQHTARVIIRFAIESTGNWITMY